MFTIPSIIGLCASGMAAADAPALASEGADSPFNAARRALTTVRHCAFGGESASKLS